MAELGDWSDHDNKKYIGKLDRIYVSMTEGYEVGYFIDKYLKDHGDLPPVDVPIKSGSPGSRLLDGYLG